MQDKSPRPSTPDTRAEVDPDVAELLGLRPIGADSVPDADELDVGRGVTDTAIDEGDLVSRADASERPDQPWEDLASDELRAGETDDPNEAAEEGLTWVAPVDPPTRIGDAGEPEVAAGFGTTAEDEPFDADHHAEPISPHDERAERVVEALRDDAATARLAGSLAIDVDGGRVFVSGVVEDLDDEDAVLAVVGEVPGVTEVVDDLLVRGLEETEPARD